jgi:hypothetical protein
LTNGRAVRAAESHSANVFDWKLGFRDFEYQVAVFAADFPVLAHGASKQVTVALAFRAAYKRVWLDYVSEREKRARRRK